MNRPTYTNLHNIPLALAVWLVNDDYDYQPEENYISITGLMKPLRQIILAGRPSAGTAEQPDLSDLAARALGNSIHDSVEKAWVKNYVKNLQRLGYPDEVIARVRVNPSEEELQTVKDIVPVYIEQRAKKQIGKWTVGGKFDMVAEGIVHDNKSTSAYTWVYGGKDGDYKLQGSLYKWLNPDKIFADFIRINFVFTDWAKAQARQNPNYPQARCQALEIPLMEVDEADAWIRNKLSLVEKYIDAPEKDIPQCTDEELWLPKPSYKYYADPAKTSGRSTKNSDTLAEAREYQASKGGKGIIITVQDPPNRCGYCEAFANCTQKDKYFS